MAYEFKFPDVGEGITEGEILAWKVKEGETVAEGQTLAEVETDKAVVELPSPRNGRVLSLGAGEGDIVNVGDVIVTIEEVGAAASDAAPSAPGGAEPPAPPVPPPPAEPAPAPATPAPPVAGEPAVPYTGSVVGVLEEAPDEEPPEAATVPVTPAAVPAETAPAPPAAVSAAAIPPAAAPPKVAEPGPNVLALPSVRALAKELGVDLNTVRGTGAGGRILKQDVQDVAQWGAYGVRGGAPAGASGAARAAAPTRAAAAGAEEPAGSVEAEATEAARERGPGEAGAGPAFGGILEESELGIQERVTFRGIRRTMAKRMAESSTKQAQVTVMDEADVSIIRRIREKEREVAKERGVRLTYMAFVIKACTASLKRFPHLNASLLESQEEYILKYYYNIGMAVDTPSGLVVPNIKDADKKSIFQIAREVVDLVDRAEERRLAVGELHGGTFTITNFGAIGSTFATPIVNYPEVAILGLGRVHEMPVVREGKVVSRLMMPLSLTFDHQLIDGAEAARFLNMVMGYLEDPDLLLLEGA